MKLTALKSMRYAGRPLLVGDEFEVSAKDARLLKAIGKAKDAPAIVPEPITHEDAGTAYDQHAEGFEKQGRKVRQRKVRAVADAPADTDEHAAVESTARDVTDDETTEE